MPISPVQARQQEVSQAEVVVLCQRIDSALAEGKRDFALELLGRNNPTREHVISLYRQVGWGIVLIPDNREDDYYKFSS